MYIVINSGELLYDGTMLRLHDKEAVIHAGILPEVFANPRLSFSDNLNENLSEFFAKVTGNVSSDPPVFRVHYTYVTPEADAVLKDSCLRPAEGTA